MSKKLLAALGLGASVLATQALASTEMILLGTKGGPSLLQTDYMPHAVVIKNDDKSYLVDAGYGASYRLVQSKTPLRTIDAIFFTHLHSDHVADYPALLSNAWNSGLKSEVAVYGPAGTESMTEGVFKTFEKDFKLRVEEEGKPDLRKLIKVQDLSVEGIKPQQVYEQDAIQVETIAVPHPPFADGEALAYKIHINGKTIVITGDMIYNEQIIDFSKDADYLVSEAFLLKGVEALAKRIGTGSSLVEAIAGHHVTAEDVGKIAHQANVKNLILTHRIPVDDPEITDQDWINDVSKHYQGNVIIAKDLETINLDD